MTEPADDEKGAAKSADAIARKRVSGTCQEWSDARGSFRIERIAKEVLLFTPRGYLEADFEELFETMVDEALVDGRPHLFWDGQHMTGYASDFRIRLGRYCVRIKPRVASMNVYTPQPLIAMGAAVINVWLGGFFTMFKTRAELLATMRKVRAPQSF